MDISTDPRSVAETDPEGAARIAAELEADGLGYEPDDVDRELSLDIYAGSISTPEHGLLRDAIDNASDQDRITYLLSGRGKRIAAIVPVEVAERHEAELDALLHEIPAASGPTRFVSRQAYANGTRQEAEAIRLTAGSHQRVLGWLQGRAETAAWSDEPPRLDFGGRRGSYSIEPGWWVVLYSAATTPERPGVEGWDPEDFDAYWIAKSEQDRDDRVAAAAYGSARRAR